MNLRLDQHEIRKIVAAHFGMPAASFHWAVEDCVPCVVVASLELRGQHALEFLSAAQKIGYQILDPRPPRKAKRPRRRRSPG